MCRVIRSITRGLLHPTVTRGRDSIRVFIMGLMTSAFGGIPNAEVLLRDQSVEHVLDESLRRELKQFVRRQTTATLLEARSEARRWEQEGLPGGVRGRSQSVPSVFGAQCVVGSRAVAR